ncbi:MAG: methyltransferase [Cyanobacteria bacterium P01_H01_bin.15]
MYHPVLDITDRELDYEVGAHSIALEFDDDRVMRPTETSFALCDAISNRVYETALDIGVGTGIISIFAAMNGVPRVFGIDKNKYAVSLAQTNAKRNAISHGIEFMCGDFLRHDFPDKFDLIISNPPFLPTPETLYFRSDQLKLATDGGPDGVKDIISFADRSYDLLSDKGELILPLARFTDWRRARHYLESAWKVETILERPIRFWAPDFSEQFLPHLSHLIEEGRVEVSKNDGQWVTILEIVSCTPR